MQIYATGFKAIITILNPNLYSLYTSLNITPVITFIHTMCVPSSLPIGNIPTILWLLLGICPYSCHRSFRHPTGSPVSLLGLEWQIQIKALPNKTDGSHKWRNRSFQRGWITNGEDGRILVSPFHSGILQVLLICFGLSKRTGRGVNRLYHILDTPLS